MTESVLTMQASKPSAARSTVASPGLREAMRRHPLLAFFLMAYAFSWIILIPFILQEWNMAPKVFSFAFVLNPFVGPALAAVIMTGLLEGKDGVRRLWRRCLQWRAGWQWYVFVLLGIPALLLLGVLLVPGAMAGFLGLPRAFPIVYLVNFVIIFFLGGPLGEEPGWRGFALPRMQVRYGPLWGTLFLGVLWAFWHLPHFLTSAQGGGPGTGGFATFLINFPIFALMVVAIAIVMAWVFNHTRGSLFIAILLHASINTFSIVVPLFPATGLSFETSGNLAVLIGFGVPALLIVVLTRGRLGYEAAQAEAVPVAGEPQPAL